MENNELIRKKSIALDQDTYERLSKFAAQLRLDSDSGAFVSMGAAVAVLLDAWQVLKIQANEDNSFTKEELSDFFAKKLENE